MKILQPTQEAQTLLGLQFERWPICRSNHLLELMKIKATISERIFPFNQIVIPSQLKFEPILLEKEDIQINAEVAYEKLENIVTGGKVVPLCLWSIDAIFGHQTKNGNGITLPERPTPGRKLIILTQGIFNESVKNAECYIHLTETENGFEICTSHRNHTFLLYLKPCYDLVTLCLPAAACSTS